MSKYSELYADSVVGVGLISEISSISTVPWNSFTDDQKALLEIAYFNRSGSKEVTSQFSQIATERRAPFLAQFFKEKWAKLYEAFQQEYSIIDPYSVTESGSNSLERSHDSTTKFGRIVDETGTDTGTVDNTGTDTTESEANLFGFNSVNAVPSDTGNSTGSTQAKETRDLAATRKTTNSGEDTVARDETEDGSYDVTKRGNLGYRSPSELVREEFLTWATPFFQMVFADIDSAITLKIYN